VPIVVIISLVITRIPWRSADKIANEKKRLGVFEQYLRKIATFTAKIAEKEKVPDVAPLLRQIAKYSYEDMTTERSKYSVLLFFLVVVV